MTTARAPVDLSIGVRLVVARRLIVGGSVGVGVFGSLVAYGMSRTGASVASTVGERLVNGSLVTMGWLGFRPLRDQGLEFVAGLGRLHGAQTLSSADLTQIFGTAVVLDGTRIDLNLRLVALEAAWAFRVGTRCSLRPSLGVVFARHLGGGIYLPTGAPDQAVTLANEAESEVEAALSGRKPLPMAALSLLVALGNGN